MTDIAISFDRSPTVLSFRAGLDDGDLSTTESLYSAVLYSLFTDRRASEDDVIPDGTNDRRGCWADDFIDEESEGSKLWLLDRSKQLQSVLNDAEQYAREALQWIIVDGLATRIDVAASWSQIGWMQLQITIWSSEKPLVDFTVEVP